ncbi:restriction endonuclease [Halorhabdus sp. CUG00001]|uniref:restriction endonuclease n=1 Tax=Halorhabdus sp. CUG00001 TaxID=2600297 RepID=UPI00131BDC85|nr:restriction endonuclease [Halorhabdus sp. CUG00001]
MQSDDREVVDERLLTETGRGGLFGEGYLADLPLEAHLGLAEQPRVVFPSGDRGIVYERGRTETTYSPGSGYRALVAITGRRIVMAVGGATADDSDQIHDVALDTIEHVTVERGGGHVAVQCWSGETEHWTWFPVGIDAELAARRVREGAQAWIRFDRLLSEARAALAEAARNRTTGAFEATRRALDRAESSLTEAGQTAAAYDAPASGMNGRLARLESRRRDERRRLSLARARSFRTRAENHWRQERYERAAEYFERARATFQSLRSREDLSSVMAASVRQHVTAIDDDLDRLSVSPLSRAIAAQRAAERAADPLAAVDHWRDAFERFRALLQLEWGRADDRFAGERSLLRDRLATVVEGLVVAQQRAAERRSQEAQRLRDDGQLDAALSAYDDARESIDRALATAAEFTPEDRDALHERRTDIRSQIEAIARQKHGDDDTDSASAVPDEPITAPTLECTDTSVGDVGRHDSAPARQAFEAGTADNIDTNQRQSVCRLQTLDDDGTTAAVGRIWQELGWTVDLLEEAGPDAIATRSRDDPTLLLWVRRRGVPVTAERVEALIAQRNRREGDHSAILVTTDPIDPAAFDAAMTHGVTLVDNHRLSELARKTGVRPDAIDDGAGD